MSTKKATPAKSTAAKSKPAAKAKPVVAKSKSPAKPSIAKAKPIAAKAKPPASKAKAKSPAKPASKPSIAKKPAAIASKSILPMNRKGWDSMSALKKAFFIGLGATVMTGEKLRDAVKELVDEMVAKGDLHPEEAKKVAEDLKRRFLEGKTDMEDGIRHTVEKTRLKTLATLEKVSLALHKPGAGNKAPAKKPASVAKHPSTPVKAAAMKASKPLSAAAPKKTGNKAPIAKSKKVASSKKAR